MAEGINFHDNGTISVPIGAQTFTLKRPTTKQLFDMWDYLDDLADDANEHVVSLVQQMAEMDEDDTEEAVALTTKIRKERRHAYEYTTIPWLRKAFQLINSVDLPDDLTDAPSELTDPSLAVQILNFWRTVPLAQSPKRPR